MLGTVDEEGSERIGAGNEADVRGRKRMIYLLWKQYERGSYDDR